MKKIMPKHINGFHSATPLVATKQARNRRISSLLRCCSDHDGICFAVAAAIWVLILYWKAMSAPFVYDDLAQIVNNPSLHSWSATFTRFFLTPVSFTTDFLGAGASTYRPLFWLTLALDRHVWGISNAGGFHFTNILIHWANGILFFQLLRRVRISAITAAMVSIAWLGLPINSEAVAWVSGRAYLLSTFFVLLSLLSAYSYLSGRKLATLAYYFVFSLGALFSHEEGLLLLPLIVVLMYASNQRDRIAGGKLVGTALVADILYVAVRYRVGTSSGQGTSTLWSVGLEFWKYVGWILAPVHMSIERSTSVPPNTPSIAAVMAWGAMLALVGAAFLLRKKAPIAGAGIMGGCIALLPVCGVVYIYQGMAERFLYLASIGFTLSIVSLAIANRKIWKGITVGGLLLWMMWGAWRLTDRVLDWGDPVSLYQSSLKATPNSPTLFYNLGFSLRERGDLDDALNAYQNAIRLRPNYQRAFSSIGEVYDRLSKPAEAVKAYAQALILQPDDAGTIINYAVDLEQTGNNRLAEQQFKRAIALAPKSNAAYIDLGSLYVQENRVDEAIQYFEKAITNNPNDPIPYFDLAVMFQKMGHDDVAFAFYKKVLALKPNDPDTLLYISKLHIRSSGN